MARITVEDCIDKFRSRFELVLVASNRARKLHSGETPTVEKDNDKNTVIALREIAQETITSEDLKLNLIEEYQTSSFATEEELEEDEDNNENSDSAENKIIESNEYKNPDKSLEEDDFSNEDSYSNEDQDSNIEDDEKDSNIEDSISDDKITS